MNSNKFTKLIFIVVIGLSLSGAKNSFADISGKLEFKQWHDGHVIKSGTLINSNVQASFMEAFVTGLKLASAIQSIVDGNIVTGGIAAYQEARALQSELGDKQATDNYMIGFDRSFGDKVEFIFTIESDDDPFGYIKSALPTIRNSSTYIPGFSKQNDEHWTESNQKKHASKKVTIDLGTVEPGKYVVMFSTKETDCHTCLSIVHAIGIVINEPVHNYPQQYRCDNIVLKKIADIEKDRDNNIDVQNMRERVSSKLSALESASREKEGIVVRSGSHIKMGLLKSRLNACRHAHDPNGNYATDAQRNAAVLAWGDCEDRAYDDLKGVCSDIIWGCNDQTLCQEFGRLTELISTLAQEYLDLSNQLSALEAPYSKKIEEWRKLCKKVEN